MANTTFNAELTAVERRQLVTWMRVEFRKLSRVTTAEPSWHLALKAPGPVTVIRPRRPIIIEVRVAKHEHPMSLPECLRRPDSEIGRAHYHAALAAYRT